MNGHHGRGGSGSKEKKQPEGVDFELLQDTPAWLRSLRLHKYNNIFEGMQWRDIVNLSDGDLINKGVAALGARRKMLKVFEQVRKEMLLQVCLYQELAFSLKSCCWYEVRPGPCVLISNFNVLQ
ncbi:MAG: hypothetical protein J3R72DRAFT_368530 [Linnemannia gamsii]|nr:MAG: hypothetical protein J3R72DRAFT_368530 [Linnemannia gamsii]